MTAERSVERDTRRVFTISHSTRDLVKSREVV